MKKLILIIPFLFLLYFQNKYDLVFQSPVLIKKREVKKEIKKIQSKKTNKNINPKISPTSKLEPSITPYPKYMTNQAFQLRNVILEYVKDKLTGNELIAFDNILKKESGYNPEIINEIGAGGLCQAYPYQKMPCQLSQDDWKCQVDWCLKYIENRYKNSVEAWRFHEKNNWF